MAHSTNRDTVASPGSDPAGLGGRTAAHAGRTTAAAARPRAASVSTLAAAALGTVGLAFALRSLMLGWTLSSPVPSYDGWAFVDDLIAFRDGDYGLSDLFSQHNEHRIVTARLHLFLDYAVFHLGSLSVVLADYLLFGVLAIVLGAVATRGRPAATRLAAAALALGALWSAAGWINLVWSFQIQWAYAHLMPVLAVVCFVAATAGRGAGRWGALAAACLFDGLAICSMASGLLTIVPVVAVAVWRRAPPRLALAFAAVHAVLATTYFWDYDPPPQHLVVSPAALLRYLAPMFGTAFPASKAAAIDVGAAGLTLATLAFGWATWQAAVRRERLDAASGALLGALAFALAEGVLTAFGRAGFPDPTRLALRYATPSELMWTALLLFAWRALDAAGHRRAAGTLAALAACAVAASNLVGNTEAAWRLWSVQSDNEGFNIVNGVRTDERGQGIVHPSAAMQAEVDLLRSMQLGPFAEGASQFRAPLNSLGGADVASLPACAGAVDAFELLDGTVAHVQGWSVTPGVPVSADWAMAVGRDGRVLGYARTWQARLDPRRASGRAVVLGYSTWFRVASLAAADGAAVVSVFPGHTAPPCRMPLPAPKPVTVADPAPE